MPTLLPSNAYRRVRWRNGGGWTREIACDVGSDALPGAAWHWRLSIADIERDGAFSQFPEVDRECLLLRGDGLRLEVEGGPSDHLAQPFDRHRFAGEHAVHGVLTGGRVEVLNLMWRRETTNAETWRRPLVGSMIVFVDPGSCWLVHVLAGVAELGGPDGGVLSAGDSACLRAGDERARYVIDGGGELWLARLSPPPV